MGVLCTLVKLLTDLHILDCELQEKAVNRREEGRTRAEEAVGKVFVQPPLEYLVI